jgi:hypothetical protein
MIKITNNGMIKFTLNNKSLILKYKLIRIKLDILYFIFKINNFKIIELIKTNSI